MRILVSNDDGYRARGLRALVARLSEQHEVIVCAPETQQSGQSHALTVDRPLRATPLTDLRGWRVDGSPADCVKLALRELETRPIDWVISGINHGANTGFLVHYSGTVAAAKEAVICGVPAMGVSLCAWQDQHFESAAEVAARILDRLEGRELPRMTMLNVNVPNRPFDELAGIKLAPMGLGLMADGFEGRVDPRGESYYWLTAEVSFAEGGVADDHALVDRGYAAVSPLSLDWTHRGAMAELEDLETEDG